MKVPNVVPHVRNVCPNARLTTSPKLIPSHSTAQTRIIDVLIVKRNYAKIMSKYPELQKKDSEEETEKSQTNEKTQQVKELEMEQIKKILGNKFTLATPPEKEKPKTTSAGARQKREDFLLDPSLLAEPNMKVKFGDLAGMLPKEQPEDPRALNVAMIGAPNAGKSTLVNSLVGEHVSIISKRSQTTRDQVIGITTVKNVQVVFLDTPGIISWDLEATIQRKIITTAWSTLVNADCGLLIVDAEKGLDSHVQEILLKMKRLRENEGFDKRQYALVVNKEDKVESKQDLRLVVDMILDSKIFSEYFTVSALNRTGIDDLRVCQIHSVTNLKDYLLMKAVPRPWSFAPDVKTNQSDLAKVTEIIRQELYKRLYYELPYVVEQKNFGWSELPGGVLRIDQDILVPKESQMKTVIGRAGSVINEVRFAAAQEIQKQLKRDVQLFLSVKVKQKTRQ